MRKDGENEQDDHEDGLRESRDVAGFVSCQEEETDSNGRCSISSEAPRAGSMLRRAAKTHRHKCWM